MTKALTDDEERRDARYLAIIRQAISVCRDYRPKFGKSGPDGYTLEEFQALYQSDCFYNWFGLNSPLLYAAHKAAGGITSVYRQIGTGCEKVFRTILQDMLGLTEEQASWTYTIKVRTGKPRKLSLDGRIPFEHIDDTETLARARKWVSEAASTLNVATKLAKNLSGAVFEVRQGYKSKDAKRQNADVANAANAYASAYLPVIALLSNQIDDDIAERYTRARWILLRGTLTGTTLSSVYAFCKEVLGYDLASFFSKHKETFRKDIEEVLKDLLA